MNEAQSKLLELIQAVQDGEQVTLTLNGEAVARLTGPVPREPRRFGTMKGRIKILDPDWHRPQNDVEAWLRGDV